MLIKCIRASQEKQQAGVLRTVIIIGARRAIFTLSLNRNCTHGPRFASKNSERSEKVNSYA